MNRPDRHGVVLTVALSVLAVVWLLPIVWVVVTSFKVTADIVNLPPEWVPYIARFVERAQGRIERDQRRGIAPADISPRISAQALLAMVENHVVRELLIRRGDAGDSVRVLAELWWRAVYSRPADVAASVASATDF